MFQIGEFSKLTQVSIRMLRYYDEMALLKPAYIDPQSGYRMYSAEQIPLLNKIIYLRDSGFQVNEIANALCQRNHTCMAEQFAQKYTEIQQNIQMEQEKLRKIELAKNALLLKKSDLHYQISIKSIPSYHVLSLRKVIANYYAEGDLWLELSAFAKEQQIGATSNCFSIYHDADYREEDVDVELCVAVKKAGENLGDFAFLHTPAVPLMACTMVYGPFSNIAGAYLTFAKWLEENLQYKMLGETRQIVHRGPWNEEDPEKYLVELQIPLEFTA